ncbi:torsin-1A-like isoform X2 [Pomacea canaliculata]|uniref:torsin-1A-like isoform X2 n=1 Tax=Pomacea canaliculata TaxID=400727 RepID=UPI000D73D558|nr:torsin-1A-like isoform X2 [Pomacea canaliculata]
MRRQDLCTSIILTSFLTVVLCGEPFTAVYAGAAAVSAAFIASYSYVSCYFYECCSERWIIHNVTGLRANLEQKLYGQHLVGKVVANHIQAHVRNKNPHKALALSFHGSTGTGKNHVSRIIAEALYKKGLHSKNVHLISSTKEFPHQEMLPLYKDRLRDMIEKQVKICAQSLFIFDEIDKMPSGLIDTVKPYLDYHEHLNGVNYRQAIFLFLSNAGSNAIIKHSLDHFREGKRREEIQLVDMENILAKAVINTDTKGGLWHSELIAKHLITAFIPFLPLTRKHVQDCVRDVLVTKGCYRRPKEVSQYTVDNVLKELTFNSGEEQLFSVTGCKRVAEKVDFVMLDSCKVEL